MGLPKQILAEPEHLLDRARHSVDTRVGRDPNDCAQHKWRQAKTGIMPHDIGEPRSAHPMLRHILAKGVNQDIHVRQNHRKCFIRATSSRSSNSWRPEMLVTSTPGIRPPPALLMRGRMRFFGAFRLVASTIRKPSSISEVSVRPSAAALRLARLSTSSGRRTVVRSVICLDISLYVIYVKPARTHRRSPFRPFSFDEESQGECSRRSRLQPMGFCSSTVHHLTNS